MTTPPDAKKNPETFKLGDNPNEYADDDAEPVDALESLKNLRNEITRDGADPQLFERFNRIESAWEKERAERLLTVKGTSTMYMQLIERHDVLSAAVEKASEYLKAGATIESKWVLAIADSLDAALRGGA